MLSLVWCAFASMSCVAIVHATSRVQHRARLQASADAVALACASHNEQAAQRMANFLHVSISAMVQEGREVSVTVQTSAGTASAQALRSAYEFHP